MGETECSAHVQAVKAIPEFIALATLPTVNKQWRQRHLVTNRGKNARAANNAGPDRVGLVEDGNTLPTNRGAISAMVSSSSPDPAGSADFGTKLPTPNARTSRRASVSVLGSMGMAHLHRMHPSTAPSSAFVHHGDGGRCKKVRACCRWNHKYASMESINVPLGGLNSRRMSRWMDSVTFPEGNSRTCC